MSMMDNCDLKIEFKNFHNLLLLSKEKYNSTFRSELANVKIMINPKTLDSLETLHVILEYGQQSF